MKTKALNQFNISSYDLVIFDCDGTLVDSEHLSNRIIADMLRELGIDCTNEEVLERFAGTSFDYINTYLSETLQLNIDFDFEAVYRVRSNEIFEKELLPIEGVPQLLESINTEICIASNGPKEKMNVTLKVTGLLKYFSSGNMFSAYDIQKWKPEPDLFLLAAKQMGVVPEKCLVVEDTLHGAIGAVRANMDVLVYIDNESKKDEFDHEGITTFDSYATLKSAIF